MNDAATAGAGGSAPLAEVGAEVGAEADPHPWRAALWLGLVAVVAGMMVSMAVPALQGRAGWWTPGDAWMSLRAAHYVPQGTLPLIYETGTTRDVFDGGPLLALVLAPVAAIGDLFRLQESYPFPRPHPDMWPLFGPYALTSAIPLLFAVRALATRLGLRRRRALLQGAVLVLAFAPTAIVYGHYEDVLALALVLLAFRDLFDDRPLRGAFLLAAGILFKQWSLLAVPVYVVACPPVVRFRAALRCVGVPAVVLSFFLATDYKYASAALFRPPAFPGSGHSALWISPSVSYLTHVPERAGAFVVAFVVAWLIRRERDPVAIASALGCVLAARFFFEPVVHAYYLAPGIAVVLVSSRNLLVTKFTLAGTLLALFPFHPPRVMWWVAVYALLVAFLFEPVAQLVRRSRGRDPSIRECVRGASVPWAVERGVAELGLSK